VHTAVLEQWPDAQAYEMSFLSPARTLSCSSPDACLRGVQRLESEPRATMSVNSSGSYCSRMGSR
jgi:hypothetical protein